MDPADQRGQQDARTRTTRRVGAPGRNGAMSAPAGSKATNPEKLERELLARLGLDTSATPEDVSTAHQAVSAYLLAAPRSLRTWARAQAAGADEAYALLTDPAALARAVALVGAGARPAVRPGELATPPARRDIPAPAPVAVPPAATAGPAAAAAIDALTMLSLPRFDENGRRIVSDDEIDALLAEVDPTARREVVGTAAERAASLATTSGTPRPNRLLGLVGSRAFRNLALVGATVVAIGIIGVLGFNAGGTSAAGIGAGGSPAPAASATTPVLDQAAVAALMVKIQANPNDADSLMALGDQYYQTGDFKTAGDWFAKVTAVEPTAVRGYLALGASAFNLGDSSTALTAWTKVLTIDETNVEAHYDLGFLYLNQQPPDMAGVQREWTRVVQLDPNSDIATTVKAHLDALASAVPASPGASGAPAASPASASSPSAAPASPAPSGSAQP
jgi:cytochrome c-type biogenesis protein CcmH/NrfG